MTATVVPLRREKRPAIDPEALGLPASFLNAEFCSGMGQFHSPNAKRNPRQLETITGAAIVAMLVAPQRVSKGHARWAIFSPMLSRGAEDQRQQGAFFALWADLDSDPPELQASANTLAGNLGATVLGYTSASATEDRQKTRLLVPLAFPCPGDRFEACQRILNDRLEALGITPDRATERANQVCYLPNAGTFYAMAVGEDPLAFGGFDWSEAFAEELAAHYRAEAERLEDLERRQAEARAKLAERQATGQASPIAAYNAAHPLPLVLEAYGYRQHGTRWLSPLSESGTPGVTVTKDGTRWHTAHDSDRAVGLPEWGDAFDLLTFWDHGGDRDAALRTVGAMLTTDDGRTLTEFNQDRYRDSRRVDVREAFEDLGDPEEGDGISSALLQNPTQENVALVFAHQCAGKLLYAHMHGCWYTWDDTRWRRETTGRAFEYVRSLSRRMNIKGKASMATAAFYSGVEVIARKDRAFAINGSELDADHYLLNTPGGTFDLLHDTMRPHNPEDRITKRTAVAPTPEGGERFRQFMDEVTGGDNELARFLQVSLGACLSGAVESHWMLFWIGAGRNGKNTLGDLVAYVMGDYSRKVPSCTLMAKTHEGHPTEIANLQGVRMAVSSEVEGGSRWHESRINELTGDETLTARYMRGDFFTFTRTHKHLIFGNHRPQLGSVTDALKSRIKIVPFRQSFVGREDATLPAALRKEAGYVLYWLLEGHTAWRDAGRRLPNCTAVEAESSDYFNSQGTVDAWIEERVAKVPDDGRGGRGWPKASEMYADYRGWKLARGEGAVSQTRWGDEMSRHFGKVKADGWRYVGVELAPRVGDFDELD